MPSREASKSQASIPKHLRFSYLNNKYVWPEKQGIEFIRIFDLTHLSIHNSSFRKLYTGKGCLIHRFVEKSFFDFQSRV